MHFPSSVTACVDRRFAKCCHLETSKPRKSMADAIVAPWGPPCHSLLTRQNFCSPLGCRFLSHGTHNAHFLLHPAFNALPAPLTSLSPPNHPHTPLGRRTISAPCEPRSSSSTAPCDQLSSTTQNADCVGAAARLA